MYLYMNIVNIDLLLYGFYTDLYGAHDARSKVFNIFRSDEVSTFGKYAFF